MLLVIKSSGDFIELSTCVSAARWIIRSGLVWLITLSTVSLSEMSPSKNLYLLEVFVPKDFI